MELSFIKRLADIVAHSGLEELDYAEGDARVRLYKHGRVQAPETPRATTGTHGAATERTTSTTPTTPAKTAAHTVRAGLVGTLFLAPAPDQPPFVVPGDVVQEGQPLAIVEAMKMLNAVEADTSGRVVKILVEDGAQVEAGTPLFLIEPGADHV